MIALLLAVAGLVLAVGPATLFAKNLSLFRPLPPAGQPSATAISVLIPARDEEDQIGSAVRSVLANRGIELEVIVVDDHSQDATARIIREIAQTDPRLRLVESLPLPDGWCGKQHACHVAEQHAQHELLVWIDADVTLAADALVRIAAEMSRNPAGLLSGFPRQINVTWLEKLLIPLIHFVLLGYLPISLMRRQINPSLGAGCGQLFIARRADYERAGGHAAIRASLHDGLNLPRAFRRGGIMTDLFDATDLAECRMYCSSGQVWRGLLKNAGEGMAGPTAIVPWTVILAGGQILPLVLLCFPAARALCVISILVSLTMRLASARRFKQSWIGVALHPLAVLLLLIIQWQSIFLRCINRPTAWRGRTPPRPIA